MAQERMNFATGVVGTAPSPATSGTNMTLDSGQGARFPTMQFYLTIFPADQQPTSSNAEIVWVNSRTTDTVDIVRAQKGTSAITITAGMKVYNGIYIEDTRHYSTLFKSLAKTPQPSYFNNLQVAGADFYANAGTVSIDADCALGTGAIKIVTDTTSAFDGYNYALTGAPLDWSESGFGIWIKCDDWTLLAEATIVVSTGGFYTDYFQVNLANAMGSPQNGEWQHMYLSRRNFAVGGGTPNWATANDILFRAAGTSGHSATVHLGGFTVYPIETGKKYLSIDFDDGWASAYTLGQKATLDRYGLKATYYIIPDALGTTDYMTQANVDDLAFTGNYIGGHGGTSFVDMDIASGIDEVERYVAYVREYTAEHGYRGGDGLAYPNGNATQEIMQVVAKYFGYARALGRGAQTTGAVDPYALSCFIVSGLVDDPTTLNGIIDTVMAADGEWFILTFHQIIPSGTPTEFQYLEADLDTVIAHCVAQGYTILPTAEVLRRLT